MSSTEESQFRERYEKHVGYVMAGDSAAALADMLPGVVPAVYDGVILPGGPLTSLIVGVYKKAGKWHGETIYDTAAGAIGLRSIWWLHEGEWRAAELQNFPVEGLVGFSI